MTKQQIIEYLKHNKVSIIENNQGYCKMLWIEEDRLTFRLRGYGTDMTWYITEDQFQDELYDIIKKSIFKQELEEIINE